MLNFFPFPVGHPPHPPCSLPFRSDSLTETDNHATYASTLPPSETSKIELPPALPEGWLARNLNVAVADSALGDRRPPKWTINGNLVNCSKMSSHDRHFLQLCLARPKTPLFRRRFRFVKKFTKPDRPLSSLAKSPFRSPFPFPSKSPSSIPALAAAAVPPPPPSFVPQSQSPKKIAKIFLRRRRRFALSFRHSQFLSAASPATPPRPRSPSRSPRWSRSARITKLVEAAAFARPTDHATILHRQKVSYSPPSRRRSEWSNIGPPCSRLVVTLGSQYWAQGEDEDRAEVSV